MSMDLDTAESALPHLLDRLAIAVLLVSASGRLVFANATAAKLLQVDNRNATSGASHQPTTGPDSRLRHLLDKLPLSQAAVARTAIVVPPDSQADQMVIHVLPMDVPAHAQPKSAMLAVFVDPGPWVRGYEPDEQPQFGLTAAEWRVARHIAEGNSVHEIADASGVSLNTVRTHLKKIFQKIGVRRQADLVRVMTMMSMIRAD